MDRFNYFITYQISDILILARSLCFGLKILFVLRNYIYVLYIDYVPFLYNFNKV